MITIFLMQKHYFPKSYFKENSCIENPCGAKHVGFPSAMGLREDGGKGCVNHRPTYPSKLNLKLHLDHLRFFLGNYTQSNSFLGYHQPLSRKDLH